MTKENMKQAGISLLIGACVAFLTTLFEGVLEMLQGFNNDIIAGGASTLYYWAKNFRA